MRRVIVLFLAFVLAASPRESESATEHARRRSAGAPGLVIVTPPEGGYTWVLYQYFDLDFAASVYRALVADDGPENVVLHTAAAGDARYLVARRVFAQVLDTSGGEWDWWVYSVDPRWGVTPERCEALYKLESKPSPKGSFSTPDGQLVIYWKR